VAVRWRHIRALSVRKESTMSYYEAAKKVEKQKEMEKYLEDMRKAMAQLERMIQDGEVHG
jgi:ABC-type Fe3+-citrate transport system substrate-binding protein